MTSREPDFDERLLERYRRASDNDPVAPSDTVRAAILAEGRRVAGEYAAPKSLSSFDISQPAANQPRWKRGAYGTVAAAMLAALLIGPRYWERQHAPAPASPTESPAAASSIATSPPVSPEPTSQPPPPAPAASIPVSQPPAPAEAMPKLALQAPMQATKPMRAPTSAKVSPAEQSITAGVVAQSADKLAESAVRAPGENSAAAPMARTSGNAARGENAPAASSRANSLLGAVASGDLVQAAALLDQGAAVDERDELGRTPLMLATLRGQVEAVRLLLDRGADPNAADNAGRLPLQQARLAHFTEIAGLLQRAGAR